MVRILCDEQIKKTFMIPDFREIAQAKELFYKLMRFGRSDDHFEYGIYLDGKLIGFVNDCDMDETRLIQRGGILAMPPLFCPKVRTITLY